MLLRTYFLAVPKELEEAALESLQNSGGAVRSSAQNNLEHVGAAEADAHYPPELPKGDREDVTATKEEHRREHAAFLRWVSSYEFHMSS